MKKLVKLLELLDRHRQIILAGGGNPVLVLLKKMLGRMGL
jgi:hypothetical protein